MCSAGLADGRGPAVPVGFKTIDEATKAAIDVVPMCGLSEINPRLHLGGDLGSAIAHNPKLLAELHARGFAVHGVVAVGMVGKTLHLFVQGPDHPAMIEEEQYPE